MRRNDILRMTETELAIADAIKLTERLGADTRLTDAVVLLLAARDRVADVTDGTDSPALPGLPARMAPPQPKGKP